MTEASMASLVVRFRDFFLAADAYRRITCDVMGLSVPEGMALAHLFINGSQTPSALAARLGMTSAATTALLDRLEVAGLAARRPNPADRRSVLVDSTALGKAQIGTISALYTADIVAAVEGVEPEQVDSMIQILGAVAALFRARANDRAGLGAEFTRLFAASRPQERRSGDKEQQPLV